MTIVGKNVKEKNKMIKKTIYIISICIIIILLFSWLIDHYYAQKGHIYIIPEGYKGKLRVLYNQKDKAPLNEENGYMIVKFPLNGFVETSSIPRTGKQKDKYFFYTKDGTLIPAISNKNIKFGGGITVQEKDDFIVEFWIQ